MGRSLRRRRDGRQAAPSAARQIGIPAPQYPGAFAVNAQLASPAGPHHRQLPELGLHRVCVGDRRIEE